MIMDVGDIKIEHANDMNVPVVCFLSAPEDTESGQWEWNASNFMPRKERCSDGGFRVIGDSKQELLDAVNKYVTPLYEIATRNLRETGKNYYWEANEEIKKSKSPLQYC